MILMFSLLFWCDFRRVWWILFSGEWKKIFTRFVYVLDNVSDHKIRKTKDCKNIMK